MLLEIKNKEFVDKVNNSIQSFVPKEFLDLNPTISGGFMMGCFALFKDQKSLLSEHIDKIPDNFCSTIDKANQIGFSDVSLGMDVNGCFRPRCSDIDLFFTGDESSKIETLTLEKNMKELSFDKIKEIYEKGLISMGLNFQRVSKYAVSYTYNNYDIQLIKLNFNSDEELLKSFDLHNSCISWKKGKVYVTREFLESILNSEVKYNKDYSVPEDIVSNVFQAMRLIKYQNRFNYDFDKAAYSRILSVYHDFEDVEINNYSEKSFVRTRYGGYEVESSAVCEMLYQFLGYFNNLKRQKNFSDHDFLFFINSKHRLIREYVEGFICSKNNPDLSKYKIYPLH